jgi:hypothetical protein
MVNLFLFPATNEMRCTNSYNLPRRTAWRCFFPTTAELSRKECARSIHFQNVWKVGGESKCAAAV